MYIYSKSSFGLFRPPLIDLVSREPVVFAEQRQPQRELEIRIAYQPLAGCAATADLESDIYRGHAVQFDRYSQTACNGSFLEFLAAEGQV